MKKQIIKVFLICLHIYLIYFITNIVIYTFGIEKENKVNVSYFINNIKTLFMILENGEIEINLLKIIGVISMYLVIEINIINYTCYLTEGMKEIVRYHSKSKFDYLVKVLKVSQKNILKSICCWIVMLLFAIFIINKVEVVSINDIIMIVWFLLINYIFTSFIILVSDIPLTTIILFVSKLFIYNIFLGKEYYLLIIIALILLVYLNITRKIGEKLWKLG
jgi:membrane protein